jgi:hypothetical protein
MAIIYRHAARLLKVWIHSLVIYREQVYAFAILPCVPPKASPDQWKLKKLI